MKSEEYNWAMSQAKAARLEKRNNAADPAARVSFERDFAPPVDDARKHAPTSVDLADLRAHQLRKTKRMAG